MTSIEEKLDRKERPIQCMEISHNFETISDLYFFVPMHQSILSLPEAVRTDLSLIADAKDVVRTWFNEDMEYYLGILNKSGVTLPWLENYKKFDDKWELGAQAENDYLTLGWKENGQCHYARLNSSPVILHNRWDESEKFYTPESLLEGQNIEIVYQNSFDLIVVAMSPEKMRKYGVETRTSHILEEEGIAEVSAHVFSNHWPPVHHNMAKSIFLRDYTVFYLNRLLEKANTCP